MRHRTGSPRFGMEARKAPENDFPIQPSAKDGPGRMCHTRWRQYTNALCQAAVAREAEVTTVTTGRFVGRLPLGAGERASLDDMPTLRRSWIHPASGSSAAVGPSGPR